eukprot:1159188-Pelagomonas_calceolata.AAC.8
MLPVKAFKCACYCTALDGLTRGRRPKGCPLEEEGAGHPASMHRMSMCLRPEQCMQKDTLLRKKEIMELGTQQACTGSACARGMSSACMHLNERMGSASVYGHTWACASSA